MNRTFLTKLFILFSINSPAKAQSTTQKKGGKIVIEVEYPKDYNKDLVHLESAPYDYAIIPSWETQKPVVGGNLAKWGLFSELPIVVFLKYKIPGKGNQLDFFEPGDSIRIDLKSGRPIYSGNGAEKFKMLQEMDAKEALLATPESKMLDSSKCIQYYLKWNSYLNIKQELRQIVYSPYKKQITSLAFDYLKANKIVEIEMIRIIKFNELKNQLIKLNGGAEKLIGIFDSTMYNESIGWLQSYTGKIISYHPYFYDYVRKMVERKFNFDPANEILNSIRRKMVYADVARKTFKGYLLQDCLTFLLTSRGLKEHTLREKAPEIDTLLANYYAEPGYPEYKRYVREYEQKIRGWVISAGHAAPDFTLWDQSGNPVGKHQFEGKIVLLNFLHPARKKCAEMNNSLKIIQSTFKKDTNVVFLSVLMEKGGKAIHNNPTNQITRTSKFLYSYIDGPGKDHAIEKLYNISSYPQIFLLDSKWRFVYNGQSKDYNTNLLPDPRKDRGRALINKIYDQLALIKDGPYVMYTNDSTIVCTIKGTSFRKNEFTKKSTIQLTAQTDSYHNSFPIILKKENLEEPSQYAQPEKLFILSDIEGNFTALRKLLQANNVIDEQFNWIYGAGHLVFAGDMFDRGNQVTECLWLVYSLEEKAKAAGGYVHFILGNHEIMNLNGDIRYVTSKYKDNANLLNLPYQKLYSETSELGKWLRSKNVMEKIGDLLFVHGGISREINSLDASIEQINKFSRAYYSDDSLARVSKDKLVATLYNGITSPFWHRGYYLNDPSKKTPEAVVDSTLRKFDVSRIITGHTIVDKEISVHYDGKVINTDTKHAIGHSEALLIENNHYYRVNSQGQKQILFSKTVLTAR